MKSIKRALSVVLALCLVASMFTGVFSLNSFAENYDGPSYATKQYKFSEMESIDEVKAKIDSGDLKYYVIPTYLVPESEALVLKDTASVGKALQIKGPAGAVSNWLEITPPTGGNYVPKVVSGINEIGSYSQSGGVVSLFKVPNATTKNEYNKNENGEYIDAEGNVVERASAATTSISVDLIWGYRFTLSVDATTGLSVLANPSGFLTKGDEIADIAGEANINNCSAVNQNLTTNAKLKTIVFTQETLDKLATIKYLSNVDKFIRYEYYLSDNPEEPVLAKISGQGYESSASETLITWESNIFEVELIGKPHGFQNASITAGRSYALGFACSVDNEKIKFGDTTVTYQDLDYYVQPVQDFYAAQPLVANYFSQGKLQDTVSIVETINSIAAARTVMAAVEKVEADVAAVTDADFKAKLLEDENYNETLFKALKIRCNVFLKSEFVYDEAAKEYLTIGVKDSKNKDVNFIIGGYVEGKVPDRYEISMKYYTWFENQYARTYGLEGGDTFLLRSADRWNTNNSVNELYEDGIIYKVHKNYNAETNPTAKFYNMSFEGNKTYLGGQWINSQSNTIKLAIGTCDIAEDGTVSNKSYGVFTQKMNITQNSSGACYFTSATVYDILGNAHGPNGTSLMIANPTYNSLNYDFVVGAYAERVANNNFRLTYDFTQEEADEFTAYFNENYSFGKRHTADDLAKMNEIIAQYDALPEKAYEKLEPAIVGKVEELRISVAQLNDGADFVYDFENPDSVEDFKVISKVTAENVPKGNERLIDSLTETNVYSEDAASNAPTGTEGFWGIKEDTNGGNDNALWLRKSFAASGNMVSTGGANSLPSVAYQLKDGTIEDGKLVEKVSFKQYIGGGNCWDAYKNVTGFLARYVDEYHWTSYNVAYDGYINEVGREGVTGVGAYSTLIAPYSTVGDGTEEKAGYGMFKAHSNLDTPENLVEKEIAFSNSSTAYWGNSGSDPYGFRGFQTTSQWLDVTFEWDAEKGHYVMAVTGWHKGADGVQRTTTRYYDITRANKILTNVAFMTTAATAKSIDNLAVTLTDAPGCEHANKTTTTIDATCTTAGSITVVCDDCGETVSTEVIDALGHDYEDVVTDPTCTEQGYTTHSCKVCDDVTVDTYVDALGHDYNEVVTEPTITEQGYTTYTCKVCGYSYIGDYTSTINQFVTEGKYTYYYENGQKVTGWKEISGSTYYFKKATGIMLENCKASVGGEIYYFDAEGKLVETPEVKIIDGKCYIHGKYQQYGWQEVNGATYYFDSKNEGIMLSNGVHYVKQLPFNFDAEGKLLLPEGVKVVDGKYYNCETNVKYNGWLTLNTNKYYIKSLYDIALKNTRAVIGGQTYKFDESGVCITEVTASATAYTNGTKNGLTIKSVRYLSITNVNDVLAYGVLVTKGDTIDTQSVTYENNELTVPSGVAKVVKNTGISYISGSFTQNVTAASGTKVKYCGFAVYIDSLGQQQIVFSDVQDFVIQ